jgi:16S rRNA processing protein RimM
VPKQSETEWATIGKVIALFGVRGELKVRLLTDIPNRFAQLDTVYIGPEHVRFLIKSVRPYKGDMILLGLEGLNDANTAETLRNLDICIPLDQLAQLPPDSYYQHDIIGLGVYTLDGREVGTIIDIITTGSNDVYVIKTTVGQEVLVPAIKDVIKQIDLVRRTMHIDPMPGLLDNGSNDQREEEAQSADIADWE